MMNRALPLVLSVHDAFRPALVLAVLSVTLIVSWSTPSTAQQFYRYDQSVTVNHDVLEAEFGRQPNVAGQFRQNRSRISPKRSAGRQEPLLPFERNGGVLKPRSQLNVASKSQPRLQRKSNRRLENFKILRAPDQLSRRASQTQKTKHSPMIGKRLSTAPPPPPAIKRPIAKIAPLPLTKLPNNSSVKKPTGSSKVLSPPPLPTAPIIHNPNKSNRPSATQLPPKINNLRKPVKNRSQPSNSRIRSTPAPGKLNSKQLAVLPPNPLQIESGSLRRILFKPGSAKLTNKAKLGLRNVANSMLNNAALRIQLFAYSGHTSNSPSDARRLSLSRALAAREILMKNRVRSTRIEVRALGNRSIDGPADRIDVIITKR